MTYKKEIRILVWCVVFAVVFAGNNASGYEGGDHDPYVQNVTQDSAVIMWQTDANCDSMVEYGPTTAYGQSVYDSALVHNREMVLAGLDPGTVYHYRTSHDDGSGPVYSADSTFKTAPAASVAFDFAVIADSHKTGAEIVLPQVVDGVLSSGEPALVLHAGDITDDGSEADWNWYYFGTTAPNPMMGPLINKVPMYPSIGNHDTNRETYFFYYDLPEGGGGLYNEQWYSHDYGNAHFVHIDDNEKKIKRTAQGQWFEDDLASTTAEWVFVILHHPAITDNYISNVCEEYGVDVVFYGHNHFYDRAYKNGVYYIQAATAGGDPWNAHASQWSQYTESTSGFVTVDIDGTTATICGRYPDATIFDSVVITGGN